MSYFRADISEWVEFERRMADVRKAIPTLQEEFFTRLGEDFVENLQRVAVQQNITWTGTYVQSLQWLPTVVEGRPSVMIGFVPQGINTERLPIYWKVIERGAEPNPYIPRDTLLAWSWMKFGNPGPGLAVYRRNKMGAGGIEPRPILSSLFIFDADLNPIGLTREGERLLSRALSDAFGASIWPVIYPSRGGLTILRRRDPLGRFAAGRVERVR